MSAETVIDTCVHQWTATPGDLLRYAPERWQRRLGIKSEIQDPIAGTLMPTIPWYHAYWNEDAPGTEADDPDHYTNSDQYKTPEKFEARLQQDGIDAALLTGHVVKFLTAIPNPDYAAAIASGYNSLIVDDWLADTEIFKGAILVTPDDPAGAVAEIERHADHPDMVSVLVYGGGKLPLGHEYLHPIYEATENAGLPLSIHTSGNAIHRQTALGLPHHYATQDTNLVHNHMTNMISMIYNGVLDEYPDLQVVWGGEGVSWILHNLWRATRYWRNIGGTLGESDSDLRQEPIQYLDSNFYLTTYPLEEIGEDNARLFDVVGIDNVLYASGYPHWNHDTVDVLPDLPADRRRQVLSENAATVFGI